MLQRSVASTWKPGRVVCIGPGLSLGSLGQDQFSAHSACTSLMRARGPGYQHVKVGGRGS